MAKIIKVASTTNTPKTINLFRTSRNSATNPFKYSNFEGNTLQFADVFEGFEQKNTSKLRMIAASVAGCMNKVRSVFEPITKFAGRISDLVSGSWNYAKNTNFSDVPVIKTFNNIMNTPVEFNFLSGITDTVSGIKSGISTGAGKIGEKLSTLISSTTNKISSDTSVSELENLWKKEIALYNMEVAA